MSLESLVKLNKVCVPVIRGEIPIPGKAYRQLGVRLWGNGAYERETLDGSETQYSLLNRVENNDLVVNKIWARNGSVAIVSKELAGCYVSNEFPIFKLDQTLVFPKWMYYLTKWQGFWNACDEKARGSSGKNRIKPAQFIDIKIPLPSLNTQKNTILWLDTLAEKIQQVEERLVNAEVQAEHLLALCFQKSIANAAYKTMQDVAPLVRREVSIDPEKNYPELGIRSFGKGSFHKPALSGSDVGSKRLFRIEQGDLLFSNVFAWEGAIAVAQPEDHDRFGSHRFISCVPLSHCATSPFLHYYFLSPTGLEKIGAASPGGAGRNRTLGLKKLMDIQVPVPPLATQQAFDKLQSYVAELKAKHEAIRSDLGKLMPVMLERVFTQHEQTSTSPIEIISSTRAQASARPILTLVPDLNSLPHKAAIAAYVTQKCNGNDFGKVKLAKCYYLLHERFNLRLTEEFMREAAGPWDKEQDEFLAYAAQKEWLELPPEKKLPPKANKGVRTFKAVLCGRAIQESVKEAKQLLGKNHAKADTLLKEMKKMHWELLELWATVLDSAKALKAEGKHVTPKSVRTFISTIPKWEENKLKKKPEFYTETSIGNALNSLKEWCFL